MNVESSPTFCRSYAEMGVPFRIDPLKSRESVGRLILRGNERTRFPWRSGFFSFGIRMRRSVGPNTSRIYSLRGEMSQKPAILDPAAQVYSAGQCFVCSRTPHLTSTWTSHKTGRRQIVRYQPTSRGMCRARVHCTCFFAEYYYRL